MDGDAVCLLEDEDIVSKGDLRELEDGCDELSLLFLENGYCEL
jgi:hypothetical protein